MYIPYPKKMRAVVYSKEDCPYCVKVKQVLDMIRAEVTVYTYGTDFTREEFYAEFGDGATFPQVLLNDEYVGGCTETVSILKEQGLV